MHKQIVFAITFTILIGVMIAVLIITRSLFAFLFTFPALTFVAVLVTYFYLCRRFNQSKYIHTMNISLLIYQILLILVLVLNIISLVIAIIQNSSHTELFEWYDNMTKVDNKRSQLGLAFSSAILNAILSIITYKVKSYVLRILDKHYTISNIRVFQNIQTSKAALRENLIKITNREFNSIIRDQESCLICEYRFGLGQYIYRLKCRHMFHSMCFSQWVNVPFNNSCPSCFNPL